MSTTYHVRVLHKFLDFSDGVTIKTAGDGSIVPDTFCLLNTIVDNTYTGAKYYFPYKRTLQDQDITGQMYDPSSTATVMDWDYAFSQNTGDGSVPCLRLNGGNLLNTLKIDNWLEANWDFGVSEDENVWMPIFCNSVATFFEANKANYAEYGQDGGNLNLIMLHVLIQMPSPQNPQIYLLPFLYLGNDSIADFTITK